MNGFMKDFIITTDTTTDLPTSYVNEHHLGMIWSEGATTILAFGFKARI